MPVHDEPRVVLPLPRPENVPNPESFHAALGWTLVNPEHVVAQRTSKPRGLVFKDFGTKTPGNFTLESTYPDGDRAPLWEQSLRNQNMDSCSPRLGETMADAILGVNPLRGKSRACVPLTPRTALLQNTVGMMRKENPFNVAAMLESAYGLGSGEDSGSATVAAGWLAAMQNRVADDRVLMVLESATDEALLAGIVAPGLGDGLWRPPPALGTPGSPVQGEDAKRILAWAPLLEESSPFAWFRLAWDLVTDDAWTRVLPARVWVDWCSSVFRMVTATAYLWEASWYEKLARNALAEDPLPVRDLVHDIGDLVPWRAAEESTSVRDVVKPLKLRMQVGAAVREFLSSADSKGGLGNPTFTEFEELSRRPEVKQRLATALAEGKRSLAWETVRYNLATRESVGADADFYGLVENVGTRFAVVSPGTEWVALMTAVACREPHGSSTVSVLRADLKGLGLRPELPELIRLLEESGLARGNADADEAVQIHSPF